MQEVAKSNIVDVEEAFNNYRENRLKLLLKEGTND